MALIETSPLDPERYTRCLSSASTVHEVANYVCCFLPERWQLDLSMENGSGGWELWHPDKPTIRMEEYASVDDPLILQCMLAVEYARRQEG